MISNKQLETTPGRRMARIPKPSDRGQVSGLLQINPLARKCEWHLQCRQVAAATGREDYAPGWQRRASGRVQ